MSLQVRIAHLTTWTKREETASAVSLQLIWGRETALPSPLSDSGAAGIDIKSGGIKIIITRNEETAVPSPYN